jgi:hypothetical protein
MYGNEVKTLTYQLTGTNYKARGNKLGHSLRKGGNLQ